MTAGEREPFVTSPEGPGARSVSVRAPGKINLSLRVGPPGADGFHPLVTVFQALDLGETVTAGPAPAGTWGLSLDTTALDTTAIAAASDDDGDPTAGVPLDHSNLAVRAAMSVRREAGVDHGVHLTIAKEIPAASGMAGGSADAAAALVACDRLWGTNLGARTLHRLAAELGSDVAFPLLGGSALGTGRGEKLVALPDTGSWHWVIAGQATGLSTPEVFRVFDDLAGYGAAHAASLATSANLTPAAGPAATLAPGAHESRIGDALAEGDPAALGRLLHNDLTEPALDVRPELGDVLAAFERAGALGQVLSGSGPTVVGLALDADHAASVAAVLRAAEVADRVLVTTAPARGAHILEERA